MTDAWRKQAACAGLPTEWWFEDDRNWRSALAREICAACVGKESCLADALAHPTTHGIWGGQSFPNARQVVLRRRRLAAS
ncbi:MAG: WhiB family transcriptional regulator [Ferrimicrobium acidiphilum]